MSAFDQKFDDLENHFLVADPIWYYEVMLQTFEELKLAKSNGSFYRSIWWALHGPDDALEAESIWMRSTLLWHMEDRFEDDLKASLQSSALDLKTLTIEPLTHTPSH